MMFDMDKREAKQMMAESRVLLWNGTQSGSPTRSTVKMSTTA